MNKHARHSIVGIVLFSILASALSEESPHPTLSNKTLTPDKRRTIRSVPDTMLADDRKLLADVYLPNIQTGNFPTFLMIHGGAWFSGNKVFVTPHARYAAENGYDVVAINYRLAPMQKFLNSAR